MPDALPQAGSSSEGWAEAIAAAAGRREEDALRLLRTLVQTPSVSGSEGAHDDPSTVSGLLWRALGAEAGLELHADSIAEGRDNVIAVLPGGAGGVFVLDAHTDTVPAGDPTSWLDGDAFSAREGSVTYLGDDRVSLEIGDLRLERPIRRGLGKLWEARPFRQASIIYGRGAFDNKGPVAVAYLATAALADLARTGLRLGGTVVCAFTVDEEREMVGTRALVGGTGCWLDRHGLLPPGIGPDGFREGISGVALDGSYGFVPVVGHRGIAQLVVRTQGQAAHAATPDLGVNAVTRMAAALHAMDKGAEEFAARLRPLFADDLLEPASLAVGTTIVGGGVDAVITGDGGRRVRRSGVNVVPDWCEATIDCRHPRPADGDVSTIQDRIARTVERFARDECGLDADALRVDVLGGGPPCAIAPSREAATADPLVSALIRHGERISGFQPWIETAPGGTDATVMINEGKIRTVVEFGPAGALAHEPHEFVERDQIAVGATILACAIVDILGVAG